MEETTYIVISMAKYGFSNCVKCNILNSCHNTANDTPDTH